MKTLSASQSRVLALALLLVVVWLLLQLVLLPLWSSWRDQGVRIDSLQHRLALYQRLNAGAADARTQLQQLQASVPSNDWYLPESTPALAAARLQQLLHQQVGQSGGQVLSTQILNRNEEAPLQPVAIQVHLRGELGGLVDLLYTLESGPPALFVDNLTVLANPRRQLSNRRPNDPRLQVQALPALDIRFDLTGYSVKGGRP